MKNIAYPGELFKMAEHQVDWVSLQKAKLIDPSSSAMFYYLSLTEKTPSWIDALMNMRNSLMKRLGLKDVGNLASVPSPSLADTMQEGDSAGIFTVQSLCHDEVLLGIHDSHLDVFVSVYIDRKEGGILTVTTFVILKNILGRLYMMPVSLMHPRIVNSMFNNSSDIIAGLYS